MDQEEAVRGQGGIDWVEEEMADHELNLKLRIGIKEIKDEDFQSN